MKSTGRAHRGEQRHTYAVTRAAPPDAYTTRRAATRAALLLRPLTNSLAPPGLLGGAEASRWSGCWEPGMTNFCLSSSLADPAGGPNESLQLVASSCGASAEAGPGGTPSTRCQPWAALCCKTSSTPLRTNVSHLVVLLGNLMSMVQALYYQLKSDLTHF